MPEDLTPDVPPELGAYLRDRAASLDAEAAPITLEEAIDRETRVRHHGVSRLRWRSAPLPDGGRDRRAPALVGAAMAAVLIAGVVGFAAGRQSAPKPTTVAASAPQTGEVHAASDSGPGSIGQASPEGQLNQPEMARLFDRTTGEGVQIRAFLQDYNATVEQKVGDSCANGSWCPPPQCNISFIGELSTDAMVGQVYTGAYPVQRPVLGLFSGIIGALEGDPVSAWPVHVDDTITHVRATWPDGAVDESDTVEGWAVLAHKTAASDAPTFEGTASDGTTVEGASSLSGYEPSPECMPPPPSLPAPGEVQPADAAAATQAVRQAYHDAFMHDVDQATRTAAMEDGETIRATRESLGEGTFSEAASTITVDVGDIVFTSDTEAALYFTLSYSAAADIGQQIGRAKLIEGRWVVAKDTMCSLLSMAGATCPGSEGFSK